MATHVINGHVEHIDIQFGETYVVTHVGESAWDLGTLLKFYSSTGESKRPKRTYWREFDFVGESRDNLNLSFTIALAAPPVTSEEMYKDVME